MPAVTATAPGKIILFGEHAVVYGQPAIAVPLPDLRARAVISPEPRLPAGTVLIHAPDIGLQANLVDLPENHPLAAAVRGVLAALGLKRLPALSLRVTSTIPVASGLGSGTAVSVAVIRALPAFLGQRLTDEQVSALAYEVEKLHHGTPSGVDNTVITYAVPVYFVRGQPVETFRAAAPFEVVIGDTGVACATSIAVGDLRQAWEKDPATYDTLFREVGAIVQASRQAIESGQPAQLGPLMNANHRLLQRLDVSSPELDRLVEAALQAGASGAKLSGGGRGGNMLALALPGRAAEICEALRAAGAVRTLVTTIR